MLDLKLVSLEDSDLESLVYTLRGGSFGRPLVPWCSCWNPDASDKPHVPNLEHYNIDWS